MFPIKPEFLDIFGTIGFLFIITYAQIILRGNVPPKWMIVGLLLIGIIGFLVDALVVYTYYLA